MRRLRALAASAALLVPACGDLPTGEAPPPLNLPQTATATALPVPNPTPTATPGASPSPSPSASATPPPPSTSSCALPPMPECGRPEGPPGVFGCCRDEGARLFEGQVADAIAQVQRERPDLFDGGRVRSEDAFVQTVARALEGRGLCARQGGPSDEVAVKNSNSFSEQYDIVFASGAMNTSGYTVTCRPARF